MSDNGSGEETLMDDRVKVFVDYENMMRTGRSLWQAQGAGRRGSELDPLRLAERIVGHRKFPSELVEVRVFQGVPTQERQPGAAMAAQRMHGAWRRTGRVEVMANPLHYPPDWPDSPAGEVNVDELLAADVVEEVSRGGFDVAIIASHDQWLQGALVVADRLKRVRMEVAGWGGAPGRLHFPGTATLPWCHWLDEVDYKAALDAREWLR